MEPIKKYVVDLKPFPTSVLPGNLRDFVTHAAASLQVSDDMVGLPLLSVLASALQNRYVVRVDSAYTEPLCLYTLTIARPSERKSAVMSLLEKPFWTYQSRVNETLELMGQKPITLYVTDATPEKLAYLMKENHGAISLFSDEPDALAVAAGLRYGKSRNLGLMLQAWNAGHIMIQRATEDKRVSIDRAVMCVAVMSQPSFVESLINDAEMSNRGFMQRFLYAKPLSKVGSRSFNKPEIPPVVLEEYDRLIETFLEQDSDRLRELTLDAKARKLAQNAFDLIELEIGQSPEIEGWLGKLFGQTLRLAGVLHCALWTDDAEAHEIDGPTMNAATVLAWYFLSHAKAVFTDIELTEEAKDARDLYRRMSQSGQDRFTKSDLYRLTKNNLSKTRLEAALGQLLSGQYIFVADETADDKRREYVLLGDLAPADKETWQ